MPIHIVDSDKHKKEFNQKVHHPIQSWEWGEARRRMGLQVLRITDGTDAYQITFHPIPLVPYKIGYIPRSTWPSKETLDFLSDYGRKHKVIFMKFEPNVLGQKNLPAGSRLRTSPHPLFPQWTQKLDLTLTEENLLKNMHPKTRYNIRLAQKKGIVVRELSTDEGFDIFSKLYFETCRRQKYFGHTPAYHKIVWDNLKHGIAHILVAFYGKIPLAAYELFLFDKTWYYPYGGTSQQERNRMPSNLLMWEAIRLGKKLGAQTFDLWGSLPPKYDQSDPWAGFTRFKEGYGTTFVQTAGSFDLVIDPYVYQIYNAAFVLRHAILRFLR